MKSLQDYLDYGHHLRTVVLPKHLRASGFISEGWDPIRDRYTHKAHLGPFDFTYRSLDLRPSSEKDKEAKAAKPRIPFLSSSARPIFAKKVYEIILPDGTVHRYRTIAGATVGISKQRSSLASAKGAMTTALVYPSACDPHSEGYDKELSDNIKRELRRAHKQNLNTLAVKNLRTGSFVSRDGLAFDTSENFKKFFGPPEPMPPAIVVMPGMGESLALH